MAAKTRRHSVAVMSTSFLTPSLTSSASLSHGSGVRAPTAEFRDQKNSAPAATNRVTSSKAAAEARLRGGEKTTESASKTSASSTSCAASTSSAIRARRHSVAVHPGSVLSVMESGRQATAAASPSPKKSKSNLTTASDIIDDLIRSADASLIRNSPLPTGSTVLQAAIQELDEPMDEQC